MDFSQIDNGLLFTLVTVFIVGFIVGSIITTLVRTLLIKFVIVAFFVVGIYFVSGEGAVRDFIVGQATEIESKTSELSTIVDGYVGSGE